MEEQSEIPNVPEHDQDSKLFDDLDFQTNISNYQSESNPGQVKSIRKSEKGKFKDMSYLKAVPKKIDCWLSKESKNMRKQFQHKGTYTAPKKNNMNKSLNQKSMSTKKKRVKKAEKQKEQEEFENQEYQEKSDFDDSEDMSTSNFFDRTEKKKLIGYNEREELFKKEQERLRQQEDHSSQSVENEIIKYSEAPIEAFTDHHDEENSTISNNDAEYLKELLEQLDRSVEEDNLFQNKNIELLQETKKHFQKQDQGSPLLNFESGENPQKFN